MVVPFVWIIWLIEPTGILLIVNELRYLFVLPISLILSVFKAEPFILYVCPVAIFIPAFAVNNPFIVVGDLITTADVVKFWFRYNVPWLSVSIYKLLAGLSGDNDQFNEEFI